MVEVSLIVPVYKAEHCLNRCVQSILEQSYRDFELILVDDGSPDHSGALCEEWAQKDNRIKVIHKENGGVSSARNVGLEKAKGKYVLFVDSDDYIYPDYIRRLYDNAADLTVCGLDIYHDKGWHLNTIRLKEEFVATREQIDFAGLYRRLALYSPYCKLFCREIINKKMIRFPVDISWGEDGMFVADYMTQVNTVQLIEYVGYRYLKYAGENKLSTMVRADIIDTVCRAREYCIERVRSDAPWALKQTQEICQEDIRCNCAGFVTMLFRSKRMKYRKKKHLLEEFSKNPYVKQTLQCPEQYYDSEIASCFSKGNPVKAYVRSQLLNSTKKNVLRWYEATPLWLKKLYRSMKGKRG